MNEPRVVESVTNECQLLGRAHESSPARLARLDSIGHLKSRIDELAERLPYADGQSYYDDKRKIEALTVELADLEMQK